MKFAERMLGTDNCADARRVLSLIFLVTALFHWDQKHCEEVNEFIWPGVTMKGIVTKSAYSASSG